LFVFRAAGQYLLRPVHNHMASFSNSFQQFGMVIFGDRLLVELLPSRAEAVETGRALRSAVPL
jgi:hypothetical protein